MHLYMVALISLFLPLSHGLLANLGFLTVPQCDQGIISSIKSYWETAGRPQNVLQQMEESGSFTTMYITNDYYKLLFSCISLKYSTGVMSATLLPKLGLFPLSYSYNVEEGEDGVVRGGLLNDDTPAYKWNWYPIVFSSGVTMSYLCSDMIGLSNTPLVYILVAKNHDKELPETLLKSGQDLFQGKDLSFMYNYNSQCL